MWVVLLGRNYETDKIFGIFDAETSKEAIVDSLDPRDVLNYDYIRAELWYEQESTYRKSWSQFTIH